MLAVLSATSIDRVSALWYPYRLRDVLIWMRVAMLATPRPNLHVNADASFPRNS